MMKPERDRSPGDVAAAARRSRIVLFLVVGLVIAVNLAMILRVIFGPARH